MLLFCNISAGTGWPGFSAQPSQRPLVGQLSSIELDLNLNPVHPDVTRHPEGDAVLDPALVRPALGQLPLEVLTLVVGGIGGQQALSSDQLRRGAQLSTVLGGQLDPDLGEAAPLGARPIELEEAAQLLKAQALGVKASAVDKAQSVLMGARPLIVPGHHFLHRHRGQPLSFTVPVLYTIKPEMSTLF